VTGIAALEIEQSGKEYRNDRCGCNVDDIVEASQLKFQKRLTTDIGDLYMLQSYV